MSLEIKKNHDFSTSDSAANIGFILDNPKVISEHTLDTEQDTKPFREHFIRMDKLSWEFLEKQIEEALIYLFVIKKNFPIEVDSMMRAIMFTDFLNDIKKNISKFTLLLGEIKKLAHGAYKEDEYLQRLDVVQMLLRAFLHVDAKDLFLSYPKIDNRIEYNDE